MISSMDNMKPNAMIKTMLEFNNKALILGHRVGTLLWRELKEGGKAKEDNEELKEKYVGIESELENLKGHIIKKHINDFTKGLRQWTFFCKEVDATDSKYDVNKDVIDGRLVDEDDLSAEQMEEMSTTSGRVLVAEEDVTMQVETDPTTN
ncbi:hypothetical protein DEO72_LG5g2260 [Vigna unguiculata]|uniref:Uncharacterized protein n=1 Tax=Vigna unguiculata TaxID=3917 RepID=A0A4D6M014_VIGUN|nr:hypothetical protein DEO72_LG5g2260 [Vigna unguiculata]